VTEHSRHEAQNIGLLQELGLNYGVLRPSSTGLQKSILDANRPFRRFLRESGVHNFDIQQAGAEHKRIIEIVLVDSEGHTFDSVGSVYRPRTKRGDPRMWFKKLSAITEPFDLLVCVWHGGKLWVGNASRGDVRILLDRAGVPLKQQRPARPDPSIFEELLAKLTKISARGYIPAPVNGPTAVGRLLEAELGIKMNSSKEPDFQGIEVKSARSGGRRATMFAQAPDWMQSVYPGSGALLDQFGNNRPEGRALSCTISARRANTQGLYLQVDRDTDLLLVRENELNPKDVVQWQLPALRERLASKHAETVWVEAAVQQVQEQEYLWFRAVHHTRGPRPDELVPLIRSGTITLDFLIREDSDRGYLFKIALDELDSLFAHSKRYVLS
jgi:hypothetical protein